MFKNIEAQQKLGHSYEKKCVVGKMAIGIGHRVSTLDFLLDNGYQIRLAAVLITRDILPTLIVCEVLAWRLQYLATVTILLVLLRQRIKKIKALEGSL